MKKWLILSIISFQSYIFANPSDSYKSCLKEGMKLMETLEDLYKIKDHCTSLNQKPKIVLSETKLPILKNKFKCNHGSIDNQIECKDLKKEVVKSLIVETKINGGCTSVQSNFECNQVLKDTLFPALTNPHYRDLGIELYFKFSINP